MTKITLENITEQEYLDFLGVQTLPALGGKIMLPCGADVTCASSQNNKFMDNQVFTIFLNTVTAIGINLFSNYLYEKICQYRSEAKIKINDSDIKKDTASINNKILLESEMKENVSDDLEE